MAAYLTHRLTGVDRRIFLPGQTTHGHYQIELRCEACHTPWMGVRESACLDCHAAELKAANDSHPKSKFTDPRNAARLDVLAADKCVTCHREHVPEQTRAMGVTLPDDYCYHCHQETPVDRPSHRDLPFDSCATAGCHNYHDNTALYENFLVRHGREPDLKEPAVRPERNLLEFLSQSGEWKPAEARTGAGSSDRSETTTKIPEPPHDWDASAHARAGVTCAECHLVQDPAVQALRWSDRLDHRSCATCHDDEVQGFLAGRHGMRLAHGLSPMQPSMARLPMKPEAGGRELSCTSCHGTHDFDARRAAVESCLQCHDDDHSKAYKASPHYALWKSEIAGESPSGSGVSCATCHLPRERHREGSLERVLVQHNQNVNLRPNEKMIRSVCLDCHGLAFTIDALADPGLIRTNFAGRPARHVESIDMVLRRPAKSTEPKTKQ